VLETILVAVDASPQNAAILDQAAELAIATSASVHVLTVADASCEAGMALNRSCAGAFASLGREAGDVLRAACQRLSDKGVPCRTHSLSGLVSERIEALAVEIGADLIVMGHRQLGLWQRIFENSVGRDMLDRAPCNVLIVKEGADAD
jgi:nucleotide-binding universal stress UspA family protein